jgi:hypothetical protein
MAVPSLADLMFASPPNEYVIEHLTRDREHVLCHHRLTHAHSCQISLISTSMRLVSPNFLLLPSWTPARSVSRQNSADEPLMAQTTPVTPHSATKASLLTLVSWYNG